MKISCYYMFTSKLLNMDLDIILMMLLEFAKAIPEVSSGFSEYIAIFADNKRGRMLVCNVTRFYRMGGRKVFEKSNCCRIPRSTEIRQDIGFNPFRTTRSLVPWFVWFFEILLLFRNKESGNWSRGSIMSILVTPVSLMSSRENNKFHVLLWFGLLIWLVVLLLNILLSKMSGIAADEKN